MSLFYVATAFQNYAQARGVIDAMVKAGHQCTYDWTRTDEFDEEGHPRLLEDKVPSFKQRFYAERDRRGVLACEVFILICDSRMLGALIELGIALAQPIEKQVLVVGSERNSVFYHLQRVDRLTWEEWEALDLRYL